MDGFLEKNFDPSNRFWEEFRERKVPERNDDDFDESIFDCFEIVFSHILDFTTKLINTGQKLCSIVCKPFGLNPFVEI